MCSVAAEMNVRPGPLRDRISEFAAGWLQTIEAAVREAQSRDEIAPEIDPSQLAFENKCPSRSGKPRVPTVRRSNDPPTSGSSECATAYARRPTGPQRTQVPCRPVSATASSTGRDLADPGLADQAYDAPDHGQPRTR